MEDTWLTQETHDRLTAELAELKTTARHKVQQRILAAREEGDLRENAGYHQAKEDQAFLEGRIAELTHVLSTARVGEATGGNETVSHGVRLTLRDDDGDEMTYRYTSTLNRTGDELVISPESPLGQALRGRRFGEIVSYEAPGGEFQVQIVAIEVP